MAIADDVSVAASGDIRYTGGGPNYTVLELHRFLQDLADDVSFSGDDILDITDDTPSDRSTDNIITLLAPFNIDDTLAEHLFDGSITQTGGATVYSGLVVVGTVESGTELQIVQDDGLLTNYWTTGLNADAANNILLRIIIKTRVDDADIDGKRLLIQSRELGDSYAEFSLTMGLGNSTAAIFTAVDLNNQTSAGTIATWGTIVNTEGHQLLDVTGDAVGEPYYSQWDIGSQTINDTYERTKWIGRRGTSETIHSRNGEIFRGITHEWDYDGEGAGGSPAEDSVVAWGTSFLYDNEAGGPYTLGEYVSFGTSGAVGKLIYLQDDGATGTLVVAIESGSGTVVDGEQVTGLTSGATSDVNGAPNDTGAQGGTGLVLARRDDGSDGQIWIQLLHGGPPVDNLIVYVQGQGVTVVTDVLNAVTSRTISPAFLGTSTGSNIIGAFGIGIQPADLTASDQLFDLDNTLRVPPNNVTFTVLGLISGEDRVLVGPSVASILDTDQLLSALNLNDAASSTYNTVSSIPTDTPAAGTIRVFNGNSYDRVPYDSYTGSIFTLTGTLPNQAVSHTFDYDNEGGTPPFQVGETLTFGGAGSGTAEVVVLDDRGTVGTLHVRHLTAVVIVDDATISGGTSGTTADVDTTNVAVDQVGAFVSYIDELADATQEAFTAVFDSPRSLFIRVRDGGGTPIKTFETVGTLGSAGGSVTAIRTTDA